ncbi:hypothetical protein C8B47_03695 [filamentous cyanobacterium CCP4]|nr:hypothetical protein C8B47_03695 [filamentous cyanobacterium CCP4]
MDDDPIRAVFEHIYQIDNVYYAADGWSMHAIPATETIHDGMLGQNEKMEAQLTSIVNAPYQEITLGIGDYLDTKSMELLTYIGGYWFDTRRIERSVQEQTDLHFAISKLAHAHVLRISFADRTAYTMEMQIDNTSGIVPLTPELNELAREYLKLRDTSDEVGNYIDQIHQASNSDEYGVVLPMYIDNFRTANDQRNQLSRKMSEIKKQVDLLVTKNEGT